MTRRGGGPEGAARVGALLAAVLFVLTAVAGWLGAGEADSIAASFVALVAALWALLLCRPGREALVAAVLALPALAVAGLSASALLGASARMPLWGGPYGLVAALLLAAVVAATGLWWGTARTGALAAAVAVLAVGLVIVLALRAYEAPDRWAADSLARLRVAQAALSLAAAAVVGRWLMVAPRRPARTAQIEAWAAQRA